MRTCSLAPVMDSVGGDADRQQARKCAEIVLSRFAASPIAPQRKRDNKNTTLQGQEEEKRVV